MLAPMRALATPLMDLVDEMPYAAVDAVHMDPTEPMPVREAVSPLDALPAAAVDALLAAAGPDVPAPLVMVEIRLLGGAIAQDPPRCPTRSPGATPRSPFHVGAPFGPPVEVTAAAGAAVVDAVRAVGVRRPAELRRPRHPGAGRPAVEPGGPGPPAADPRPLRPDAPLRHERPPGSRVRQDGGRGLLRGERERCRPGPRAHRRAPVRVAQLVGRRPAERRRRHPLPRVALLGRVRLLASGPHRRRHGAHQGPVRVRLRRLPAPAPDGADRLPVPGRRVGSQGHRARGPRPSAVPGRLPRR